MASNGMRLTNDDDDSKKSPVSCSTLTEVVDNDYDKVILNIK